MVIDRYYDILRLVRNAAHLAMNVILIYWHWIHESYILLIKKKFVKLIK